MKRISTAKHGTRKASQVKAPSHKQVQVKKPHAPAKRGYRGRFV